MAAVLSAGFAFAQNLQVTGIATSAEDGSPMPSVAVAVQGTGSHRYGYQAFRESSGLRCYLNQG